MAQTEEGDRYGRLRRDPERFDAAEFARQIRHEWDVVAEDWGRDEWRDFVEEAAGPVSDRLIEMARIEPGHHALDLGTGVGEPAARVAAHAGPDGRVVGIDLSPRMVEIGNLRLRRLGLADRVELRVGDAGHPPVADGSFDAAVSRWVLMLVPDLTGALGRIRRKLVPGGRLAVALWGHPSRVPMISVPLRLAERMLPAPPLPPDAPTHLWEKGAGAFADLMEEAGYDDLQTDRVAVAFTFDSPTAYTDFILAMAGPMRVMADGLPAPQRQAMLEAVEQAVRPFAGPGGRVRMVNEVLCVSGRNPR